MNKLLAVLFAGLFAAGAFAQTAVGTPANPGSPATPGAAAGKAEAKADAKVDARKAAQPGVAPSATPKPGGDQAAAAGSTIPVETKPQAASVKSKAKRTAKHPKRKMAKQGNTPT